MEDTLKVLLVEPGRYPKQVEVENTLANLQKLVGVILSRSIHGRSQSVLSATTRANSMEVR